MYISKSGLTMLGYVRRKVVVFHNDGIVRYEAKVSRMCQQKLSNGKPKRVVISKFVISETLDKSNVANLSSPSSISNKIELALSA